MTGIDDDVKIQNVDKEEIRKGKELALEAGLVTNSALAPRGVYTYDTDEKLGALGGGREAVNINGVQDEPMSWIEDVTPKKEEKTPDIDISDLTDVTYTGGGFFGIKSTKDVKRQEQYQQEIKTVDLLKLQYPAFADRIDGARVKGRTDEEILDYLTRGEALVIALNTPEEAARKLGRTPETQKKYWDAMDAQEEDLYVRVIGDKFSKDKIHHILETARITRMSPSLLFKYPELLKQAEEIAGKELEGLDEFYAHVRNFFANINRSEVNKARMDIVGLQQTLKDDNKILQAEIQELGIENQDMVFNTYSKEELIERGRNRIEEQIKQLEASAKTDEEDEKSWRVDVRPSDSRIKSFIYNAVENFGFTAVSALRSGTASVLGGLVGGGLGSFATTLLMSLYNTHDESRSEAGEALVEALQRGKSDEEAYRIAQEVYRKNLPTLLFTNFAGDILSFGLSQTGVLPETMSLSDVGDSILTRLASRFSTETFKGKAARFFITKVAPFLGGSIPEGIEEYLQELYKMQALGDKIDDDQLIETFWTGAGTAILYSMFGIGVRGALNTAITPFRNAYAYRQSLNLLPNDIRDDFKKFTDLGYKLDKGELKEDDVVRKTKAVFIPKDVLTSSMREELGVDPENNEAEITVDEDVWNKFAEKDPELAQEFEGIIEHGTHNITAMEEYQAIFNSLSQKSRNALYAGTQEAKDARDIVADMAAQYKVARDKSSAKVTDEQINLETMVYGHYLLASSERFGVSVKELHRAEIVPMEAKTDEQGRPINGNVQFVYFRKGGQNGATISISQTGNASTLLHEMNHIALDDLLMFGWRDSASEQVKADFKTVTNYLGLSKSDLNDMKIGRDKYDDYFKKKIIAAHEKFARSAEEYYRTGKAPTPELQGVFDRIRSWLLKVYDGVKNSLGINAIPKDVQEVFDRLLALDTDMREATRADIMLEEALLGERLRQLGIATDNIRSARGEIVNKSNNNFLTQEMYDYINSFASFNQTEVVREQYINTDKWLKAPNGKQSNLDERTWLAVRTPNFKRWFGDWEKASIVRNVKEFLNNSEPVGSISGNEFQKSDTPLAERVAKYYKDTGNDTVINKELGEVKLDRRGIKDSAGHGLSKIKAAAFAVVPDVIRNGFIYARENNWKGRGYDTATIIANVKIGGKDYVCEVIVKRSDNRQGFYLHEVEIKENLDSVFKTAINGTPSRSNLIISRYVTDSNNTSKVVDENGEPLALYRGTINEEDIPNTSFEAGIGIFLTDTEEVAEQFIFPREYGEIISERWNDDTEEYEEIEPGLIYKVFVNIRNPKVFDGEMAQRLTDDTAAQAQALKQAKQDGYDGVILRNVREGVDEPLKSTTYVAFNPEQIKSATDNVGTFNPNTGNIFNQTAYYGTQNDLDGEFDLMRDASLNHGWGVHLSASEAVGEYNRLAGAGNKQFTWKTGSVYTYDEASKTWRSGGRRLSSPNSWILSRIADEVDKPEYSDKSTQKEKVAEFLSKEKDSLKQRKKNGENLDKELEAIKWAEKNIEDLASISRGNLYNVNAPENHELLDWNKPVAEQPKYIKNKLAEMKKELKNQGADTFFFDFDDGETFYDMLGEFLAPDTSREEQARAASEMLREYGISGTTYVENGVRGFTIWDNEQLAIRDVRGVATGLTAETEANLDKAVETWSKKVDTDLKAGKNSALTVIKTPLVFRLATNVDILDLVLNAQKIWERGNFNHPEVTDDILKQLPRAMADPVAIFKSDTRDNSIVVMTNLKGKVKARYTNKTGKATIIATVLLNNTNLGYDNNNKITSVYAKAYENTTQNGDKSGLPNDQWFINQIKKGNLLYINRGKFLNWYKSTGFFKELSEADKKEFSQWVNPTGLQLPAALTTGKTINSIPDERSLVKLRQENNTFYQIGAKRKADMDTQLKNNRPDLTDEQRADVITEIEKLGESVRAGGNPKVEKAATHWVLGGHIILPEDNYKILDAIKICEQQHLDPMSFSDPNEILAKYTIKETKAEQRINPDIVPEFSNKQELPNGITVYDVEDTEKGQAAVRKIIDTHWSKDANPWCLAARKDDNIDGAWQDWKKYSSTKKRIAFQNGVLLAFSANDKKETAWWDRTDKRTVGIPFNTQDSGDKLAYSYNENTKKETLIKREKTDGTSEIYYENGKLHYYRRPDNSEDAYDKKGNLLYKNRIYQDGNEIKSYETPDGIKKIFNLNKHLHHKWEDEDDPTFSVYYGELDKEILADGTERKYHAFGFDERSPDGSWRRYEYANYNYDVVTREGGKPKLIEEKTAAGIFRRYYKNGKLRYEVRGANQKVFFSDGKTLKALVDKNGKERYFYRNGRLKKEVIPKKYHNYEYAIERRYADTEANELTKETELTSLEWRIYKKDYDGHIRSTFNQIIGSYGAHRLDLLDNDGDRRKRIRALENAKIMEDGGWKAKAIKYATGWERGADGRWRYEIPDGFFIPEKIKINKPLKLPEVYDSPELYRAYPQLKDVNVIFKKLSFNLGGQYDPNTNTITKNSTLPFRDWRSGFIHEIQHAIQYLEEFTEGTNRKAAGSYKNYERTAGEVEARNAGNRKDMSERERRHSLLVDTEDIKREDQLINLYGKNYTYDEFQELRRRNPASFNQIQIPTAAEREEAQKQAQDVREQYENTDKWLKAPNGKQSNLDGWQWTEVRTPNFKRYFGDWENAPQNASKAIDENGEPLVVWHGTDRGGFSEFYTRYGAWFASRMNVAATYSGNYDTMQTYEKNGEVGAIKGVYNYPVYLNIRNPFIFDAQGKDWHNLFTPYIIDKNTGKDVFKKSDGTLFKNEAEAYHYIEYELNDVKHERYDVKLETQFTDDIVSRVQAGKYGKGYDGVIFKNILDIGGHLPGKPAEMSNEEYNKSLIGNVYVVFNPEQIKSATDNVGTFNPDTGNIFYQTATDMNNALKEWAANSNSNNNFLTQEAYDYVTFNQTMWHGTRHNLNGFFDLLKIGTGEGSQSFGWGIYLAENKVVAENYRTAGTDKSGNLYEVNGPENDVLLDWDKPFSKQPMKVIKAINKLIADADKDKNLNYLDIDSKTTGEEIYEAISSMFNGLRRSDSDKMASELLNKYGIPGLRYLDGMSRKKGEGTHNFVIWNTDLLKIIGVEGDAAEMENLENNDNLSDIFYQTGTPFNMDEYFDPDAVNDVDGWLRQNEDYQNKVNLFNLERNVFKVIRDLGGLRLQDFVDVVGNELAQDFKNIFPSLFAKHKGQEQLSLDDIIDSLNAETGLYIPKFQYADDFIEWLYRALTERPKRPAPLLELNPKTEEVLVNRLGLEGAKDYALERRKFLKSLQTHIKSEYDRDNNNEQAKNDFIAVSRELLEIDDFLSLGREARRADMPYELADTRLLNDDMQENLNRGNSIFSKYMREAYEAGRKKATNEFSAERVRLNAKVKNFIAKERAARRLKEQVDKATRDIHAARYDENVIWSKHQRIEKLYSEFSEKHKNGKAKASEILALAGEINKLREQGRSEFNTWERGIRERAVQLSTELAVPMIKKIRSVKGKIKKVFDYISARTLGAERFFDRLDGGEFKFNGAFYKLFVDGANEAENNKLKNLFRRHDAMKDVMKELGLTLAGLTKPRNVNAPEIEGRPWTADKLMSIYAGMKNEKSREAILFGVFGNAATDELVSSGAFKNVTSLTEEEQKAFNYARKQLAMSWAAQCVSKLTYAEKALADAIMADYEANFNRINNKLIEIYNRGMGHEENYSPIQRLELPSGSTLDVSDIGQEVLGRKDNKKAIKTDVPKGSTKSRQELSPEYQTQIKLGLLNVWNSKIEQQEHAVAYGAFVRDLRNALTTAVVVGNRTMTVEQLIKKVHGKDAWKFIENYFTIAAQNKTLASYDVLEGMCGWLAKNASKAYLCYNLSSALKQWISLPRVLPHSGFKYFTYAIYDFLHRRGKFLDECYALDPQLRNRKGNVFLRAMNIGESGGTYGQIIDWGFQPMVWCDQAAAAIAFRAVYDYNMANGKSEEEAIRAGQRAVALTQQATHVKDTTMLQQQKGLAQLALLFSRDTSQTWGMTIYDLAATFTSRKVPEFMYTILGLSLAAGIFALIAQGSPDDDEGWLEFLGEFLLRQEFESIPLLGKNLINIYQGYSTNNDTISTPFYKVKDGIKKLLDTKSDNNFDGALDIAEGAAHFAPFPVTGVRRVVDAARYGSDGEFWKATKRVLFGRKDKEKKNGASSLRSPRINSKRLK